MTDTKRVGAWVTFNGRTFPGVGEALGELEWTLRYGEPTQTQLLAAASVLHAYCFLVKTTNRDRLDVTRRLKAMAAEEAE